MAGPRRSSENPAGRPLEFLEDEAVRLWVVGGKGGVGKSTIAAALSLYLASHFPGRRCLAVSTGPLHSLGGILGVPLSAAPTPVHPFENLLGLELDAARLFCDFKRAHGPALRTILGRGTYLDEEDIGRFLELSFPGLDELMGMVELIDLLESGRYDTLIVDTAPTGHALRLLSLPELTAGWVAFLDRMLEKHRFISRVLTRTYRRDQADEFLAEMNRDLSRLRATLQDQQRCRFVAVTLPEPVVLAETERLLAALEGKGIAVGRVVVNQWAWPGDGCALCRCWEAAQQGCLATLLTRHEASQVVMFPACRQEVRGEAELRALAEQAQPCEVSLGPASGPASAGALGARLGVAIPAPEPGLEFFLFCGKGGVGKTTLSCAFALQLSQHFPCRRILLFSTDPAHSLSDCLGQPIGPVETRVEGTGNLFAVEIDPEGLFDNWKRAYSRQIEEVFAGFSQRAGLDVQFDREVITGLLDLTPPGLDELMCLSELAGLLERRRYDLHVLDTAPAGHTLRFLELFGVVRDWLRAFFEILLKYRNIASLGRASEVLVEMSQRVKKMQRILSNPQQCRAIPVSIPAKAARQETEQLLAALGRAGIRFDSLLLNQAVAARGACGVCASVAARQRTHLQHYRRTLPGVGLIVIPRSAKPLRGPGALMELLRFEPEREPAAEEAVTPAAEQVEVGT